ncbi:sodium:proton antiporter [Skermanella stibiiresistens SB22]|uniref:Na(+)/H(+) antiporter NhaA n=1 Tax=Skermanella stibiiresistens SB22 TaxID=1385369 RepID=W9HBD9_9PROT|nr:Na+/H+ antiporter NhaA [Skermanella stibiiresistens]EWY41168.1 sodium:proton antiporter [Skermanella stibiiresistens SB22]
MASNTSPRWSRPLSMLRQFIHMEASGGLVLMAAAAAAMVVANSPLAQTYFTVLNSYVFGLSVGHWINDALMAIFFLLVGLEIKREFLDGQLSTWSRRVLPGAAAVGGMLAPALIYIAFNLNTPETLAGWAIPAATDIAFALGVLSLLGSRVPMSLRVFLTALAILDDLGAVLIIAVFYTADLSLFNLGMAAVVLLCLIGLNRFGVAKLWPYLVLAPVLWFFVFQSGIHATLAGVALALTIPLTQSKGRPDDAHSPLHRLEHALVGWVAFLVIPIFGFANAGVSLAGLDASILTGPVPLGIAVALFVGKQIGVFGAAWAVIRLGAADLPIGATMAQLYGVALLCGIGFTMSLFIGVLAFPTSPELVDSVKVGVLAGSLVSGLVGWAVLMKAPREAMPVTKAA